LWLVIAASAGVAAAVRFRASCPGSAEDRAYLTPRFGGLVIAAPHYNFDQVGQDKAGVRLPCMNLTARLQN